MTSSGPPIQKMSKYEEPTFLPSSSSSSSSSSNSSSSSTYRRRDRVRSNPQPQTKMTPKQIMASKMPNGVAVEFSCDYGRSHMESIYYVCCFEKPPTFDELINMASTKFEVDLAKFECRLSTSVKDATYNNRTKLFPIKDNKTLVDLQFLQQLPLHTWEITVAFTRKKTSLFGTSKATKATPC